MGIYWLASYPKSGNTWLRVFLANYLQAKPEPVSINALQSTNVVDRELFDEYLGFDSSDLTANQVDHYRASVYARMVARQPSPVFLKTHAAFARTSDGQAIFRPPETAGAIYLARHPMDVCVSLAHHSGHSIDETIATMAMPPTVSETNELLPEHATSWSDHVLGWLDQTDCPVLVVRYEDLIAAPLEAFSRILSVANVPVEAAQLAKAVDFSRFERLQAEEVSRGFEERSPAASSFFRAGRAGTWRNVLTSDQVRRLTADHQVAMRRLGYLTVDLDHAFR